MVQQYKLTFSDQFYSELYDIARHIAYASLDIPTAEKTIHDILHKISTLKIFPEGSPLLDKTYNLRYIMSGKYRIIFRTCKEKGIVRILTIRHGRMSLNLSEIISNL